MFYVFTFFSSWQLSEKPTLQILSGLDEAKHPYLTSESQMWACGPEYSTILTTVIGLEISRWPKLDHLGVSPRILL